MPITRQLTDEELNNLEQQGIDSTGYKGKEVTLASDDELAALQATQTRPQAQPEIGKLSTIARTLKAHAGGIVGGGQAALGTIAGVGALGLAPETFGGSLLLLPLLAAAGYGGSLAGEKIQQKVLGDETQNRLEQEAQEAAAQNPITALATDITGSALASGGSFKPSNIPRAGRAIVSAIGRKAVDEVDKHALASVLINGAVNPAINSGISYATTGQLPSGKDLLSQAVGGALFSGQNKLGELASGIGQPKAEPVAEPTSKPEVKPNDAVRETPFIQKDDNNNFLIDNKAINEAFAKAVPKPDTTSMSDSDRYIAETNYRKQTKVTDEQKRNFLHEAFLKKVDELDSVKIPSDNQPVTQAAPVSQPSIKPTDLVTETETANDLQKQLADEGNKKFAPSSNEDDYSRYNEVQARMKQLIEDKMYGGDEFAKLWKENEDIKNRNGGMPPTEGNKKYAPEEDRKSFYLESPSYIRQNLPRAYPEQIINTLKNKLPAEYNLLNDSGVISRIRDEKPSNIASFIEENSPKVEVHTYGMEEKANDADLRRDMIHHELDTIQPGWQNTPIGQVGERARDLMIEARQLGPRGTRNQGPRATSAYSHVSPKDVKKFPVQRVDVTVPMRDKNVTTQHLPEGKTSVLWPPDSIHEQLPNTLGWAAIQYEMVGGEKVAHVFEVQSRWGQWLREAKQQYKNVKEVNPGDWSWVDSDNVPRGRQYRSREEALQNIPNDISKQDHPLLHDYNRLILKAAIEQARKEGATKVVVSDAETAMMSEGHDLQARHIVDAQTGEHTGRYFEGTVPQEKGMRLNYDTILPRIMEELTGGKGEKVELGEHKNAFEEAKTGQGAWDETYRDRRSGSFERAQRKNLIFRNPDGTPKTSITGRMYDISNTKNKFSLANRRYAPSTENNEQSHPFKTVQEAINHIQENSTNEHYKELAESLDLDDKALGVKIGQSEHDRSYYDVDNDTIKLAKNAPEYHVMHEIIHAATSKKLQQLPENHPLIKELQSAFEEAKAQTGDKSLYGLKDVHEFVAEALTNKSFQEHLNGIQYDGKTTIWQRIVQTVGKMLGIPPKEHSMLESVMRASQELIKSERPTERVAEKTPVTSAKANGTQDAHDLLAKLALRGNLTKEELDNLKRVELNPTEKERVGREILAKRGLDSNIKFAEQEDKLGQNLKPVFRRNDSTSRFRQNLNEEHGDFVLRSPKAIERAMSDPHARWTDNGDGTITLHGKASKLPNVKFDEEGRHYAPKEKEIARPATGGFLGKIFRSSIDRIRDINHPAAEQVADAFHKTLNQREQYTGEQLNPILEKARRYDIIGNESADKRLEAAARYERETGKDGSSLLRNKGEREVFQQVKDSLKKNFEERFKNEEPVYQHGNPRMPQRDEFYWPTTTNPKIAEIYRSNNKPEEIAALDKKFLDYQKKLGVSEGDATENLKNWKEAVQGSTKNIGNMGNNQYFNASRRAQGVPLPPEFTRPGFLKNIEAYFHRQAMDNAYYKHVESNPEVMSALGETLDAWKRPIEKDPTGGIAGNEAVRRQLEEFRGEVGGAGYHNEKALSSLATTLFIGPGTTVHKVLSNLVGATNYLENPYAATRFLTSMLVNADKGLAHATENGIIKLTAKSTSELLRANLSFAERLQTLAHTVRGIYSLGDLTDRWGTGLLQAGLEGVMPRKVDRANAGDTTQQTLIKRLDPDYKVGKTYDDKGISQLTSQLINSIHGTGDGRTMPPWMSGDSEVSGFFKLSHWGISQTNRFFSDIYTPATRGNIAPLMTSLFGAAVGGYIIKELRESLQGKKGQIPSLQEIASSERGLKGNVPLLAYNLMAACSYAGFGGMLSQFAKLPFDKVYKNTSQGMVFPLDEVVTDMAKVLGQTTTAIANDPNLDWLELTKAIAGHFMTTNFQLGRVAINQAIDHGLIDGLPAEKKMLSDKLAELRRFNMVEGLPYNETENAGNSFNNLEQRKFKFEQNPDKIAEQLPVLINNIIKKYSSQPDVMMQKIKALKENSYATFPSLETEPLQFGKFLEFLQKTHGKEESDKMLMDYMQHKMINAAKSEAVP